MLPSPPTSIPLFPLVERVVSEERQKHQGQKEKRSEEKLLLLGKLALPEEAVAGPRGGGFLEEPDSWRILSEL